MDNKHYVSKSFLLGELANYIVQQSPYLPDNLSEILKAADKYIDEHPFTDDITVLSDMTLYGYKHKALKDFLDKMCHELDEIKVLNLCRKEVEAGLTAADVENQAKRLVTYSFVSRYNSAKKEWDFVSLGALSRNILLAVEKHTAIIESI